MHYDVVIIGAGMSGLAAAIRLAHFGRSVCVFERHTVWGGLNSFYKKGGHHFDTGLHAMTNWLAPGYRGPRIPLQRIYRQLRIKPEEFALEAQTRSRVQFGQVSLTFENGLERMTEEVAERFPAQADAFVRMSAALDGYPDGTTDRPFRSARAWMSEYLDDELLLEMILAPLLWYGSAQVDDMDEDQFRILFNSIYREGFCRPRRGVKQIIETLVRRAQEVGAEVRRRCGVSSLEVRDSKVTGLVLDDGEHVTADVVLSSAGLVETERLRSDRGDTARAEAEGQLSFTETVYVLDRPAKDFGWEDCIVFYNEGDRFAYRPPEEGLVDVRSAVICCPDNFGHDEPLDDYRLRFTHLASHAAWRTLEYGSAAYERAKQEWEAGSYDRMSRVVGDFKPYVKYVDSFTPRTVTRFTGHINGAVYGSSVKTKTGATDLDNLFICGTDQGMLGIVGAMLSGIAVANAHGMVAA